MPLKLRRHNMSLKYAAKIKTTENHPTEEILTDNWQQQGMRDNQKSFLKFKKSYLEQIMDGSVKTGTSDIPQWHLTQPEVDTSTHDLFKKKETSDLAMRMMAREKMLENDEEALQKFTDGSRDGIGRVGAAFYIPQRNYEESF